MGEGPQLSGAAVPDRTRSTIRGSTVSSGRSRWTAPSSVPGGCCPTRRGRATPRSRRPLLGGRGHGPVGGEPCAGRCDEAGARLDLPQSMVREDPRVRCIRDPRTVGELEVQHALARVVAAAVVTDRPVAGPPAPPRTTTGRRLPGGSRAPPAIVPTDAHLRQGGFAGWSRLVRHLRQRGVHQPLDRCAVVGVDAAAGQPVTQPVGGGRGDLADLGRHRGRAQPGRRVASRWCRPPWCWCGRRGRATPGPDRSDAPSVAVRTFSSRSDWTGWPTLIATTAPGVRWWATRSKNSRVVR